MPSADTPEPAATPPTRTPPARTPAPAADAPHERSPHAQARAARAPHSQSAPRPQAARVGAVPALELRGVTAGYPGRAPVVRDVSLTIGAGESVALLGPSGCGKSTLARVVALLHRPASGEVVLSGTPATGWRYRASRAQRTSVGVVFQQPRAAADPRLSLADLIAEPLRATKAVRRGDRGAVAERVLPLAERVGLTPDLLARRPHEVSDGQLQRACVARALVLGPSLLICDEMTAMLDASTTAALVAVVEGYRAESGAALLAVGHDRPLLARWCSRVHDHASLGA
ncbi:ABC-type dipeptide/oligopeptide/nickel transport system ATPase subunit [Actinocorallia herbida]|uniref:ABC-type dipeptide/oligopeptide/nickel transport system ATPase subunit n=1 Tax=Actinocorallia herbida TaxID=58109 RepID=A0A3N1DB84_9ACTN|nr:ATP-binding cassette domain-containing protein [Actinocorallia herbida]ROO90781.1 ABC-type dipeptide/oligopeptide/nickel transport system ATPase subunit [Actinocorallia herbida]